MKEHLSKTIAISSTLLVIMLIATQIAFARPTDSPPTGNPALNVQGPLGPQGPTGNTGNTGSQGPQGPTGVSGPMSCTNASASCSHGPWSGCATSVQCPSGYNVTGGGYYLAPTGGNVIVFRSYMSGNGWYAYCHDSAVAGGATLYVYARCCRS